MQEALVVYRLGPRDAGPSGCWTHRMTQSRLSVAPTLYALRSGEIGLYLLALAVERGSPL